MLLVGGEIYSSRVRAQFELVSDCPACRVDGTVTELYDPGAPVCAFGLPAESACRLCLARWAGEVTPGPDGGAIALRGDGHCPVCARALTDDEVTAHACCMCGARAKLPQREAGVDLRDRGVLEGRLRAMADEDGERDLGRYLDANFLGRTVDQVHEAVRAGDRVETGLDAWFSLFGRGGRGASPHAVRPPPSPPKLGSDVAGSTRRDHDPRAMLLALVSILVADGQQDPREVAFVDRFLAQEGFDPLRPSEVKVHRPMEIASRIPPSRRAEVVELMAQLACVDGEADPSELRVLSSYASAWGIPIDDVEAWVEHYRRRPSRANPTRFLQRIKSFFVVPREAHR